jgi:CRISPR/Cas system CSM-associated protein Csm2 small subunit
MIKKNKVEDDNFVLEIVSCQEALKAIVALHKFVLQYKNTI